MTTTAYCIKRRIDGEPNPLYLGSLCDWHEEIGCIGCFTFEQAIALYKVFTETQGADYYYSLHTFEELYTFEDDDDELRERDWITGKYSPAQ